MSASNWPLSCFFIKSSFLVSFISILLFLLITISFSTASIFLTSDSNTCTVSPLGFLTTNIRSLPIASLATIFPVSAP